MADSWAARARPGERRARVSDGDGHFEAFHFLPQFAFEFEFGCGFLLPHRVLLFGAHRDSDKAPGARGGHRSAATTGGSDFAERRCRGPASDFCWTA